MFPNESTSLKINGFERRIEILKSQIGKSFKMEDIKKYLPSHLIPNKDNQISNTNMLSNDKNEKSSKVNLLIEKYKEFLNILKDDLKRSIEGNMLLTSDITEVEEERNYYLDKLIVIYNYIKSKESIEIQDEDKLKIENIMNIITHIPDDFK